jgi:hypothetical protein
MLIFDAIDSKRIGVPESPNGANRSSGEVIKLFFRNKQVDKVNIYGKPEGTYFPENLVNPDELRLLGFRVRNDKPVRIKQ